MAHPFILIASLVTLSVFYLFVPAFVLTLLEYRGSRQLQCPETGRGAEIGIAASRAAATQFLGAPRLAVARCTLWPEESACGQQCLTAGTSPAR